jgi:hypothetical protein
MRIGKCKECKGELWLSGKNYFNGWEQHTCSKCGKVYGGTYEEYLNGGINEKK